MRRGWWPTSGRFLGVALVGIGVLEGSFLNLYERGTFHLLLGTLTLYTFDWRPESLLSRKERR